MADRLLVALLDADGVPGVEAVVILHASAHRLPLKDESVHCVVTSPPYLGLRNYNLPPQVWGDGWTGSLGLEPTMERYLEHLLEVMREVKRVLRPDGTCWLNLGDSYAGSGQGWCQDGQAVGPKQETNRGSLNRPAATEAKIGFDRPPGYISSRQPSGLKPKDLYGIPWRVAFTLQADGWWLRSDIIYSKLNPMPESVTDRPTRSHEYVFLLTKSQTYFYDAEAVKVPSSPRTHSRGTSTPKQNATPSGLGIKANVTFQTPIQPVYHNLRSVWTIPTQAFSGAHFATFPEKLVEPCILAGTSEKGVCPACGAPWARIVHRTVSFTSGSGRSGIPPKGKFWGSEQAESGEYDIRMGPVLHTDTLGWKPTCRCRASDPIPATCLDPFGGSGTVGEVCERLGRRWISVDLAYHDLAKERTAQRGLRL